MSLKTVGRTAGPWRVHVGQNGKLFVLGGKENVAQADVVWSETTSRHNDGNANLIASSPDLLAACEAALDAIDNLRALDADLDAAGQDNDATWDQLRTAIAKARGQ